METVLPSLQYKMASSKRYKICHSREQNKSSLENKVNLSKNYKNKNNHSQVSQNSHSSSFAFCQVQ